MVFTKEMSEVIDFLSKIDNYAIFGGFATEIHTGIESSPDIDVYIWSEKEARAIPDFFIKNGWKKTRDVVKNGDLIITLEKNETTLDLMASDKIKRENMMKNISIPEREKVKFKGKSLYFVCKEELFLEKMMGATARDRLQSKQDRDKKAVNILRKKINNKKLKSVLERIPSEFFTDE